MSARRAEGGYVSVLVLLMTALLATLAAVLLRVASPGLELTRLGVDEVRADALLDGGASAAGYLLFAAKHDPKSVDGEKVDLGDGAFKLAVSDDGGRVDLNTSEPPLLAGLFTAVGGSSMSAATFAARVVDWRDADGDLTSGGAEAGDYQTAALAYGPRNGPFQSIEELLLLLGLSRADYERLAPYLTVFNPSGHLDVMFASRTALLAVPQADKSEIDAFLAKRAKAARDDPAVQAFADAHGDYLADQSVGSYRVRISARLTNGYAKTAEVVMIASSDDQAIYRVVAWVRGTAAETPR